MFSLHFSILLLFLASCQALPLGTRPRSLDNVIAKIEPRVAKKISRSFAHAHVPFPPKKLALVALKKERHLEVWAPNHLGKWTFVKKYRIQGASGLPGPKLKQGDRQVPEGLYEIAYLHPNSDYHLSMKLNYPNRFDREKAKQEKRKNLGGDIFIHGRRGSSGCLAMGDANIESLFYLVAKTGTENTKVVIAPNDLRYSLPLKSGINAQYSWIAELYGMLKKELDCFR